MFVHRKSREPNGTALTLAAMLALRQPQRKSQARPD